MDIWHEIDIFGPNGSSWCLPQKLSNDMKPYERRQGFCTFYSYSLPNKNLLQLIANFIGTDKCLEIGAGSGLWSFLLNKEHSLDIIATDISPIKYNKLFFPVLELDANSSLDKFTNCNTLLMCWPESIYDLSKFRGNKIIYIGEHNGCTTSIPDSSIFKLLDTIDIVPNWQLIYDKCYFYERI